MEPCRHGDAQRRPFSPRRHGEGPARAYPGLDLVQAAVSQRPTSFLASAGVSGFASRSARQFPGPRRGGCSGLRTYLGCGRLPRPVGNHRSGKLDPGFVDTTAPATPGFPIASRSLGSSCAQGGVTSSPLFREKYLERRSPRRICWASSCGRLTTRWTSERTSSSEGENRLGRSMCIKSLALIARAWKSVRLREAGAPRAHYIAPAGFG